MSDEQAFFDKDATEPAALEHEATEQIDIQEVRNLIERLLPDHDCQQHILNYLADIILAANDIGTNRWAVTLSKYRVRLNVGSYVAYEINSSGAMLAMERSLIEPAYLSHLQELPGWEPWTYKSYPTSVTCIIPCDQFAVLLPMMRPANLNFVQTAAGQISQIRAQVRAAHEESVIDYLRITLGRDIPDPEYNAGASKAEQFAHINHDAIVAACNVFDQEHRNTSYWQNWEKDPTYRYTIRWNNKLYPIKEIVRIASGVEHFNSSQARRVLTRIGFAIETLRKDAQHIWLFQANPRYFDLAERVGSAALGDEDAWTVTRYRDEMRPGEPVVLWLAGPQAGIYAIGELTGEPREHTFTVEDIPQWITPNLDGPTVVWQVPFRYTHVLPEPIRKATCQEHPALQQMVVLKVPNGTNFKLTSTEWETIQELLEVRPPAAPPARQTPLYTLPQCAADLGIDAAELSRWLRALERKGQIVLYGPPGTGKTFAAQHLARHLVSGGDGFVELVQFHPAYAYEDFIQGIRPQSSAEGALAYPVVPGRFMAFCDRAKATQDTCVLIIDEINRANLARVFGELMYLLEYRNQVLPLAGGGLLSIPSNVRIIGTMNTADRSIALVDHALRRRFAFLALVPNYDQLRRYHNDTHLNIAGLVSLLERVNLKIADPHYTIGTSFFLRNDLAEQIEDIWRMEIEPYLEEYFFDQPKTVSEFRWEHVRTQVQP